MAVLRFLSALFFLIALVALAADATPLFSGEPGIHAVSASQRWSEIAPAALSAAHQSLTDRGVDWIWTAGIAPLLAVPASILFAMLGLLFGYAGRRRRIIKVFVN